jgi:formylglycine-generating enzyme required for sulfatase activity
MKFVWIDPVTFRMGSDDKNPDEKPAHMVTLSKGFYLQTTEVTQRQWEAVMGTNPSQFKGPDRPVETVSWEDAQEFLKKLNAKEKDSRYRLPSEAEWECACRAGGQEPDEAADLDEVAWWGENSSGATHPVGQKQPNAWGLFDMRGNVWEWVEDWYDGGGYAKGRQLDPVGPDSGCFRVLRGGSWDDRKRQSNPSVHAAGLVLNWEGERRAGGRATAPPEPGGGRAVGCGVRGQRVGPGGVLPATWAGLVDAGTLPKAAAAGAR